MKRRKILVTAALPYANGPIHLGHLVEYIQTDIWARFQRLRGHEVLFVCADDTHGTAIMLRAQAEGRSEEEVIAQSSEEHQRDFAGFGISFDNYGSTHSDENRKLCGEIWQKIRDAGLVKEKQVEQLFDTEKETFLADRFVTGTCPKCGREDQAGDNCVCGHTYSPTELINPISKLSGTKPETREANHLFIELEQLRDFLTQWSQEGNSLQPEVANYLKGQFLNDELRDWDISRPAQYFGFEIPDSPGDYWYVWFDAPIGYMASTQQWCDANGQQLDDWWKNPESEVHHFIGKDIIYFHTLFWPGMLKTAGYNLPEKVRIHGFLTVDGKKMSKRDGTAFTAETYLKHLDPSALRYFYASKLGPALDDIDLDLKEFCAKVDTDLVNKVVNLASRCAKFLKATGLSEEWPDDGGLFQQAADEADNIAQAYEDCDFNKAMRLILAATDRANPFIENAAPWVLKKEGGKEKEIQDICTIGINLFRQIIVYLAPVVPELAKKTGELLNDPIVSWEQAQTPLLGTPINKFKHMMKRIESEDIEKMTEETKAENEAEAATGELSELAAKYNDSPQPLIDKPIAEECTFDDFIKVDLRVARVLQASHVEGADKLLQLTLGLGGNEQRNVFAGIKSAYDPADLEGRLVVMVANLKPRKMRFGLSEGMVCAAGAGGAEIYLLDPDDGALPGQRIT